MAEIYTGVKFRTIFQNRKEVQHPDIEILKHWCNEFHQNNLAPVSESGAAGNLSFRTAPDTNNFIITAARTELKSALNNSDFAQIIDCNMKENTILIRGTREPSSESMLHYSIYKKRPEIMAVFHGHSPEILACSEKMNWPVTHHEQPYGSFELIESVMQILHTYNFIIMKNHGFIAMGSSIDAAGKKALQMLKKCTGRQF